MTGIWTLRQTASRLAIAAAAGLMTGGLSVTPVHAADLGGDCCADLEERAAELEATTVRKGNRKVSVKLSGHVNRAILWWDDGDDGDVLIVDNGLSNTRYRITGEAKISPGLTAGFRIENEFHIRDDSNRVSNCDQDTINGTHCRADPTASNDTDARWQDVWIKHKKLGKVSLGHGNTASNGTSEVDLSGTSSAQYSNMRNIGREFVFRTSANAFTTIELGDVYNNHDGLSRDSRIRYDTPTFAGFAFSTSYGQDDQVDAALRFKKEWNSVRCAWAGAIAHDTNDENDDQWIYSTSGSCSHAPSGLSLTLGYSETDEGADDMDQKWWFIKAGISRRWNSHGKTSFSAQYANNQDRLSTASTDLDDELDSYGVAFVQKIDSAALELYGAWYHHELSDNSATTYQDLDFVILGAKIKF